MDSTRSTYTEGCLMNLRKRGETAMILYKRHRQGCQYKDGSGKDRDHSHRCTCSVWVEWNTNGKQNRKPVRDAAGQPTSSWSDAAKLTEENVGETGNPAVA